MIVSLAANAHIRSRHWAIRTPQARRLCHYKKETRFSPEASLRPHGRGSSSLDCHIHHIHQLAQMSLDAIVAAVEVDTQ